MQIKSIIPEVFAAKSYLIWDEASKEAALIDTSDDTAETIKEIEKTGAKLKYILITHAHFDHVGLVADIKAHFPEAKVLMHKDDMFILEKLDLQCDSFGTSRKKIPEIDEFIDENTKISLGKNEIKIFHTAGHSAGSVCYLTGDMLFCGDTLFYEEIGRCDLPTGSFSAIEKSIKEKLFKLDDNVKCYCGHGHDTTIGHEKKYNAYFGENSRF